MRKLTITLLSLIVCVTWAQNYKEVFDIPYTNKTDAYAKERLKLDIHYDEEGKNLPVIVWFHGGGLTQGEKEIPKKLKDKGFVVVGVNYRLLPNVSIDKTLDDAAESLAWITKNIGKYGGDSKKIVVSGHSAGGYITLMLALDRKWLARYGVDANDMAGYVPFSGQAISHFSYRKMLGIDNLQPTIDEYAPLFWVRKDCPPMELIVGDRELELFGRYEENAYLWRMMKLIGNTTTNIYELDGHDHGGMVDPGFNILERFVRNITK
ncbi:MAG: alpha/beta hydrolase [Prevotellaceae bacterium]|nr:alpha/beta hydrolase [Prevotellaceae bacterium]